MLTFKWCTICCCTARFKHVYHRDQSALFVTNRSKPVKPKLSPLRTYLHYVPNILEQITELISMLSLNLGLIYP